MRHTSPTTNALVRKLGFLTTSIVTALLLAILVVDSLAFVAAEPAQAAMQGTNGKIGFPMVTDGHPTIYLADSDGSNLTQLTAPPMMVSSGPAISPDGTEIAFSGGAEHNDIYVMDAVDRDGDGKGDNLRRLTNDWGNDSGPTWSPDGKKIAFSSDIEDGDDLQEPDIYMMNADGSNRTNLISQPGEDPDTDHEGSPAFSPDGKKIAFATSRDFREDVAWSVEWQVYVMNLDGSNQTRLTRKGGYAPTFSPDGKKIAFANSIYLFNKVGILYDENGMPDKTGERYPYGKVTDIYAMNADGSAETRLTSNSSAIDSPGYGPRTYAEIHAHPAYSPDGSRIAFARDIRKYDEMGEQGSFRGDIHIMNTDGADLVNLTSDLTQRVGTYVDWGPKPGSATPAKEATAVQEITPPANNNEMKTLVPSGGPGILLPTAFLLLGGSITLGYAVLRRV